MHHKKTWNLKWKLEKTVIFNRKISREFYTTKPSVFAGWGGKKAVCVEPTRVLPNTTMENEKSLIFSALLFSKKLFFIEIYLLFSTYVKNEN